MSDPAAGTWEFAGGHIEGDESPRAAAMREFQEETGLPFPDGEWTGTWTAGDGIYQGFVLTIPREADLDILTRRIGTDPDGDVTDAETIAWWDPADLPGNPAIRPELLASIDDVMAALAIPPAGDCCGGDCCQGGCCGGASGCGCTLMQCGPAAVDEGAVAKAVTSGPKVAGRVRPGPEPIWGTIEDRRAKLTRKHERAVLAAWNALTGMLDSRALVREYRAGSAVVAKYADPDRNRALDLAATWLAALAVADGWTILTAAIGDAIRAATAEGEADALAVAADRQGVAGFRIGPAYDAAYERTGDDPGISRQADDAARKMLEGTAAVVSGVLAGSDDDSSEDETSGAVDDVVTGNDVQPVTSRIGDLIWGAIGAGLTWLLGKAGSGNVPAPPPAPGETPAPPAPPAPPSPVFISWVTDGNPCLACIDNEQNGPYAPQDVPAFPAHPRCKCNLDFAGDVPSSFFAAYLLN